jgi:hypothetical protein
MERFIIITTIPMFFTVYKIGESFENAEPHKTLTSNAEQLSTERTNYNWTISYISSATFENFSPSNVKHEEKMLHSDTLRGITNYLKMQKNILLLKPKDEKQVTTENRTLPTTEPKTFCLTLQTPLISIQKPSQERIEKSEICNVHDSPLNPFFFQIVTYCDKLNRQCACLCNGGTPQSYRILSVATKVLHAMCSALEEMMQSKYITNTSPTLSNRQQVNAKSFVHFHCFHPKDY